MTVHEQEANQVLPYEHVRLNYSIRTGYGRAINCCCRDMRDTKTAFELMVGVAGATPSLSVDVYSLRRALQPGVGVEPVPIKPE
jgi:hypothetical protein